MSDDEFDELALRAELTSDCGHCGALQGFPMSIFADCDRGRIELVGIDMRGDGWRLMQLGASITVYCGHCGRIDDSCRSVPIATWRIEDIERAAADRGWTVGALVGRSSVWGELAVYTVALSSRHS